MNRKFKVYCHIGALFVFALLLAGPVAAQDKEKDADKGIVVKTVSHQYKEKTHQLKYLEYVPKIQDEDSLPVLVFLHGAGERGSHVHQVGKHGPLKLIRKGKALPFIVIAPQCPSKEWWGGHKNLTLVKKMIDQTVEKYGVESNQIYITGLSMGGFGTWAMLERYPNFFAAAIPICGGGNPKAAPKMVDTPIWVFHGEADKVVTIDKSQVMVDAIKKAGGELVKFTIYPKVKHDSWTRTYNNQKVYEWLLSKKLDKK